MKEYRVTLSLVIEARNAKDAKQLFIDIISDDSEFDFIYKELSLSELYTP